MTPWEELSFEWGVTITEKGPMVLLVRSVDACVPESTSTKRSPDLNFFRVLMLPSVDEIALLIRKGDLVLKDPSVSFTRNTRAEHVGLEAVVCFGVVLS